MSSDVLETIGVVACSAVAGVLVYALCLSDDDGPVSRKVNSGKSYAAEYGYAHRDESLEFSATDTITKVLPDTIVNLEGRIIKVQQSAVTMDKNSHNINYVFVNDSVGKTHVLLYPYSKAIIEREAKIKYRPLPLGYINSDVLVKTFVTGEYSDLSSKLEAEGIITGDIKKDSIVQKGITYLNN